MSPRLLVLAAAALVGCSGEPVRAEAPPRPWLAEVAVEPPAEAPRGGYWLSADLVGPAAAQQDAAQELGEGLVLRIPAELPPPGILVGHEALVEDTIRWIDAFAFEPHPTLPPHPRALQRNPAPAPAGGLLDRHGATLISFIVSGATPELRPRTIDWPLDQSTVLPPGSTWLPAALVPDRAPLFAAPAPRVPPAAEAHDLVHRRGGLFVVGWFDRCTDHAEGPSCLRWAQVIARDGDRFSPGYLPMFQVARRSAWVRGEASLPRAQLIASAIAGGQAQWILLVRTADNELHRRTLRAPADPDGWPRSSLRVEGQHAIVTLGDQPAVRILLDPSLDARPREPVGDEEQDQ